MLDVLQLSGRRGDVRGFHYQDSLCFFREADGAVRITKNGVTLAVIDPHSWASVVASMSKEGEDRRSYEAARIAHLGQ